jgi:hypothetical protein
VVAEEGVALTTQTYAEQLGRTYAEAACGDPLVEEIWVSTVPGCVRIWLVTPSLDASEELRLHGYTRALYDKFQKADFMVHPLNPRHFRIDVRRVAPIDAVQIPLQSS